MSWPEIPWSEPGNWHSQEGVAASAQAQSIASSGGVSLSGTSQTEQSDQTVSGAGGDVQHIIGATETLQGSQTVVGIGSPRLTALIGTAQGSQSVDSTGSLLISGAGTSGQGQTIQSYAFKDPVAINVALQRLIDYPHSAVFDKAPDEELALRISGSSSLHWNVSGGVLTVTVNNIAHKYDLKLLSFAQLGDMMALDEISVDYENPAFSSLGAHMLLDGSNDQSNSNGTHLYAYSSELWVLFAAYSAELDLAAYSLIQALRQMIIRQSSGEWLDLWGALFNHKRAPGKHDSIYAEEIPKEAFRIRVNAFAIEQAVLDITGKDIIIEEPWENIFRLDESALSGSDRLYDGSTTGYHLIRPVSPVPIDWTDVLTVIHRNRAAGIKVLEPETRMAIYADARIKGSVSSVRTDTNGYLVSQVVDGRLDYMQLSAGSYQRNYEVSVSTLNTYSMVANCPAAVSMQFYSISGVTWRDPNSWGEFTWAGDGEATTYIDTDGFVETTSHYYDIDILEI